MFLYPWILVLVLVSFFFFFVWQEKTTAKLHLFVGYVEIFFLNKIILAILPNELLIVYIYTLYLIGNFSGWIVWHVKKLLPTRFEKYFTQDLQHLSLWTLSTRCAALCPCVTLMTLKLSWTVCISNVSTTGALQWWWPLASIREGSFTPVRMLLMMAYIHSHKDSKFEWKAKKKAIISAGVFIVYVVSSTGMLMTSKVPLHSYVPECGGQSSW